MSDAVITILYAALTATRRRKTVRYSVTILHAVLKIRGKITVRCSYHKSASCSKDKRKKKPTDTLISQGIFPPCVALRTLRRR